MNWDKSSSGAKCRRRRKASMRQTSPGHAPPPACLKNGRRDAFEFYFSSFTSFVMHTAAHHKGDIHAQNEYRITHGPASSAWPR